MPSASPLELFYVQTDEKHGLKNYNLKLKKLVILLEIIFLSYGREDFDDMQLSQDNMIKNLKIIF